MTALGSRCLTKASGWLVVVGEIVWVYADVVGFGIVLEANGFDVGETFDQGWLCLQIRVHAVHDTTVAREDDGEGEVAIADETGMFGDLAAGDRFCWVAVPVGFI